MKTRSLMIKLILFCLVFSGCKKDTAVDTNSSANISSISSGTWRITSFTQRTEDKASDFSGMNSTFSSDGKVAVTGSKTANGTWSYSAPVAGYYGGPASLATVSINITPEPGSRRLSRAWNVGSIASGSFKLDNPEPLEDEHILFTKN